jgi:hypothetical protein
VASSVCIRAIEHKDVYATTARNELSTIQQGIVSRRHMPRTWIKRQALRAPDADRGVRCRMRGGLSTGWKTEEGKQRSIEGTLRFSRIFLGTSCDRRSNGSRPARAAVLSPRPSMSITRR